MYIQFEVKCFIQIAHLFIFVTSAARDFLRFFHNVNFKDFLNAQFLMIFVSLILRTREKKEKLRSEEEYIRYFAEI